MFNVVAIPVEDACFDIVETIKIFYQPKTESTCDETYVTPTTLILGNNDSFDVTCNGTNIASYNVVVFDAN